MSRAQTEELKEHEKERDFLCVVRDAFRAFARKSSIVLGSAWAFSAALLIIIVWIATGPIFHFSDTWQLIINTATNIIALLMVFLIQNTQNRDAKAMHLKLDEVIRALKKIEEQFKQLRKTAERNGPNMRHSLPAESR